MIGAPATASEPLIVASTPISAPTEISMLPEMMTIDMPIGGDRDIGVAEQNVGKIARRRGSAD